jgi:ornithine cyclodeaminase/alanine dehydrogenase-like protein (mu-crystallin family)
MSECLAALEDLYRDLGEGRAITRPRSDTIVPTDRPGAVYGLKSMDGVMPRYGVSAIRINSDVINWPVREGYMRREKIPAAVGQRWVGLVLLFSAATGEPLAILPDGVLQRLRVGATNGLAAKYLARPGARQVGLFGSGWQAGAQVMAICAVHPVQEVRVYSPNREHRTAFCAEMTDQVGVEIRPVDRPELVVADADVVLCATNSIDPLFQADWLRPGMHVGCIRHCELDAATFARADRLVVNYRKGAPDHYVLAGAEVPELAEGKGWTDPLGRAVAWDQLPELGEIVAGKVPAREQPDEITCFLNNIGLGVQFAAAGARLLERARAAGAGHELPTEWFTQTVHP